MDQKEIETIRKQAKELLEKFSLALEKVKNDQESNLERIHDRRNEGQGINCNNNFREAMLENAPVHDSDFIIAEKKTW